MSALTPSLENPVILGIRFAMALSNTVPAGLVGLRIAGATMANFTGLASDGQRRSLLPFSGLIPD